MKLPFLLKTIFKRSARAAAKAVIEQTALDFGEKIFTGKTPARDPHHEGKEKRHETAKSKADSKA